MFVVEMSDGWWVLLISSISLMVNFYRKTYQESLIIFSRQPRQYKSPSNPQVVGGDPFRFLSFSDRSLKKLCFVSLFIWYKFIKSHTKPWKHMSPQIRAHQYHGQNKTHPRDGLSMVASPKMIKFNTHTMINKLEQTFETHIAAHS